MLFDESGVALVSVVGPSLLGEENHRLLLSNILGLGQLLTQSDLHLRTSSHYVFNGYLRMTLFLGGIAMPVGVRRREVIFICHFCSYSFCQQCWKSEEVGLFSAPQPRHFPAPTLGLNDSVSPQDLVAMGRQRKRGRRKVFPFWDFYYWNSTCFSILS